ncbi:hypothetical protein Q8A73_009651 [Channa argus]|nr:hypothetical protein Q8A73_009651 [Channa argus]
MVRSCGRRRQTGHALEEVQDLKNTEDMDMPLSAAESARQYTKRRDANPEQREAYFKKERERWRKDRDTSKKKAINDLTQRGKCSQRKKWKEAKTAARAKARTIVEKYKKRYQRMKRQEPSVSPHSKVRELVRAQKVRASITRALLFHTTLVENIRQKYRNAKTERERQLIARVTSGSILKSTNLRSTHKVAFGYSKKRNVTLSVDLCATVKKKESGAALEIKREVRSFSLRDDVSRMKPGC